MCGFYFHFVLMNQQNHSDFLRQALTQVIINHPDGWEAVHQRAQLFNLETAF